MKIYQLFSFCMKKIVLLLPAAVFFAGCNLKPTVPVTGNNVQKAMKLSQIIDNGGQADCTVTNLVDSKTTQIIVSGKKIKLIGSDMGQGKNGTIINDTVYSYIWSEGEKTGIKTKVEVEVSPTPVSKIVTPPADTSAQAAAYEDETKYKIDCTQRLVTDSEFLPPADVKFTDVAEMMKALPTTPKMPQGVPSMPSIPGYN
jgi:hypothetical protein